MSIIGYKINSEDNPHYLCPDCTSDKHEDQEIISPDSVEDTSLDEHGVPAPAIQAYTGAFVTTVTDDIPWQEVAFHIECDQCLETILSAYDHNCGEYASICDDGYCIYGLNECATHDIPFEEAVEWERNKFESVGLYTRLDHLKGTISEEEIGCVRGCAYERVQELSVESRTPASIYNQIAQERIAT